MSPVVGVAGHPAEPLTAGRRRGLREAALVPMAAGVWWLVGFLPWIASGLEAPVVSGAVGGGVGTVRIAVPLLSITLGTLLVGAVLGGVCAGLLALAARSHRGWAAAATATGVGIAVVVALVQSTATLSRVAPGFSGDPRVLLGLAVVVAGAALVGWAMGSGALFGAPGQGIALGLLAGVVPAWLLGLVLSVGVAAYDGLTVLGRATDLVGAAVLACALVVVGVRPPARLGSWPVILVVAWLAVPIQTAAVYLGPLLRPGAGLPGTLPDSLAAAWQVFGQALSPAHRWLVPWVLAVVVAVAVSALRARRSTVPAGAGSAS
ncbi:MAG: hypothetical protein ABWY29_09945 [Blastococcus sp.]